MDKNHKVIFFFPFSPPKAKAKKKQRIYRATSILVYVMVKQESSQIYAIDSKKKKKPVKDLFSSPLVKRFANKATISLGIRCYLSRS